jgi:hypothetical protein
MKLTFIGANGSMGLNNGKTYDCKIFSSCSPNRMWVEWMCYDGEIRRCPYSSIRKLLENWKE